MRISLHFRRIAVQVLLRPVMFCRTCSLASSELCYLRTATGFENSSVHKTFPLKARQRASDANPSSNSGRREMTIHVDGYFLAVEFDWSSARMNAASPADDVNPENTGSRLRYRLVTWAASIPSSVSFDR